MKKFLLLLLILPHALFAASGDYNDPATASGTNWTNPTNVLVDDAQYALYQSTTQDYLCVTNFTVGVPTGATIDSIIVRANGKAGGSDPPSTDRVINVGLTKNGISITGMQSGAVLNDYDSDVIVRGAMNDLWFTTWTPAEINATTFGVIIQKADANNNNIEIDHMQVKVYWTATLSVSVTNSTFAFGTYPLNTWLPPESSIIINDGTSTETFKGKISQFTTGSNDWQINNTTNGSDTVRSQWSITSNTGPWTDISAYNTDFTIATSVAVNDSVDFWFRIETPTSTTSYNQYSSTLTVTAE